MRSAAPRCWPAKSRAQALISLQYRFDAVDVGEMFTPGHDQPPAAAGLR